MIAGGALFFFFKKKSAPVITMAVPERTPVTATSTASTATSKPDQLLGHSKAVSSLIFSKDGKFLTSGSEDGTVRLWDLQNGQSKSVIARVGQEIDALAYTPDEQTLAIGEYDGSNGTVVELLSTDAGTLGTTKSKFSMPNDVISSLEYLHDGKSLVAAETLKTKVWDASTGQLERTLESGVNTISFVSPDGATIATGGTNDKHVSVWTAATGEKLRDIETSDDGLGVESLGFSSDGKVLASSGHSALLQIWDITTWSKKGEAKDPDETGIYQIVFAPGKNVLATVGSHGIRYWDADQVKLTSTVQMDHVKKIAFSPDGQTLAVGFEDGKIKLLPVTY